ncbi:hypothetical protein ACOMHN_049183 [Nucella lapillus]
MKRGAQQASSQCTPLRDPQHTPQNTPAAPCFKAHSYFSPCSTAHSCCPVLQSTLLLPCSTAHSCSL